MTCRSNCRERIRSRAGHPDFYTRSSYKSATTLTEVKHRGGTWKDILWDFSRGYIDFRHISGAAGMAELMRRKIDLGIAQSPASIVDQSGNVVTADHFSSMSLVESLQHDYALAAIEHIEGLSHRVQRQLQKALGETTLTQFAHCCASRILIMQLALPRSGVVEEF